ncbi:lipopolysaccharide assembly protein LapB [Thioflexithrix psekupsensis]|uniref:Lipopolysaccharide assembly protein B n=1 Tax=Thioflexithrix psekupsensis TaxID=1570016 RepID=A0A251X9H8_9GAMM|nr:lipopolysaccharide assembly protein LapB [Thioflexithrix psekupsensis]OUD14333.1 lipopolysaccharide assembly protein LapB [Thioflexithrix psekupsensis]
MNELLWLLLPIAAASGWFAARRSFLEQSARSNNHLSLDYFRGLNYLLNEQPDKAIDVFIKLIDVDSDTVETHLALGALFRRRGEVDRAIRIHQNLIARPTLNTEQRSQALLELGQDYFCAGLLDRAEDLLLQLTHSPIHQLRAYYQLLDIYQQEHDWDKAIHTARQLSQVCGESLHPVIAQYHCEQADYWRQQHDLNRTHQALAQALHVDPNCVRASLLEGELSLQTADYPRAITAFKRVEQQDPDYLSEVIEPLQQCYEQLQQTDQFADYLNGLLKQYNGITPMLVMAKILKQQQGDQHAADFIVKQLHRCPSIRGLDHLLDLALMRAGNITHDHLLLLKDMTKQLLRNKPIYKCGHCGFTGKTLHWQCPSCKQWNTVKPIQGIDGE